MAVLSWTMADSLAKAKDWSMTHTVRKRHEDDLGLMTDKELIDNWEAASREEIENPSSFLRAVIDAMAKRDISSSSDPRVA